MRRNFDFTISRRCGVTQGIQTKVAKQISLYQSLNAFASLNGRGVCVCVGGGAASSWEVQRRELWTFSLLKEFLPRQQYKTINFESDQNLQFVIENTCSWDWAELLLPNCVWQEWISTELQSIPDFMASLSIGVLISRFYVGGFLVIH